MASILDFLNKNAEVLHPYPPNVYFVCPGCGTHKKKCSINVHKGIGACFRASCSLNSGFNFPKLISELKGTSLSEAYSIAAQYSDGIEYDYQARSFGLNRDYPKGSLPIEELINYAQYKDLPKVLNLVKYGVAY